MRRFILLVVVLFLSVPLWAQLEVKQGSFKEVPGFVNINPDENYQTDDNELPFAVIKVRTENITDKQRKELSFKGNAGTFIMLEYRDGEVWVYLTAKYADYLKISHPDFSSIEYTLPFDLQPKKGYEMTLVNKTASTVSGSGTLTITTKPENGAAISLNGKGMKQTTPFTYDMIAAGQYEITVTKERYKPVTKIVTINDGDNQTVEIEMPIDVATITINADKLTNIYVDDIFKKKGDWTGELYSGDHVVRYKKDFHNDVEQTITVEAGKAATYGMNPTPILGSVSITSEPAGAAVFIDGERFGTTPVTVTDIIIGPHKLTLEKENCATLTKNFSMEEGKPLTISEKLITGREYTITTDKPNDKIFVDGEFIGNSPLTEVISYGEHIITFVRDNNLCDDLEILRTLNQSDFWTKRVKLSPNDNTNKIKTNLVKGAISGKFSVSDKKKVYFSKGNLQYRASTNTWRFAQHQWDFIGDDNRYISPSYSGWIDLYGWGTGNDPTKVTTSDYDYRIFSDWGNNTISNGESRSWFTLTNDEWVYVCDKRNTSSGIRYVKVTMNGVKGVILLPDDWNSSFYSLINVNYNGYYYNDNIISLDDWINIFEANGAVFLPAAGELIPYNLRISGGSRGYSDHAGYYWSATYGDSDKAYYVNFHQSLWTNHDTWINYHFSVRLVTLAE